MRLPPLLLGVALLFWGWHTRLLWVAAPLALILELGRALRVRWDFSVQDFQRIWNGCLVLLLVSVLFSVGYSQSLIEGSVSGDNRSWNESMPLATRWALLFFQWLPLVFAPFITALVVSRRETLPLAVFSWLVRRRQSQASTEKQPRQSKEIPLEQFYLALVLASTSTCNRRSSFFFLELLALLGWGLWRWRSPRVPGAAWMTLLLLAGVLGFGLQIGLNQLQRVLMNMDAASFSLFGQDRTDPLEARTSLGAIGQLKLSGKIVLRVSTTNEIPGDLLREASYDTFNLASWTVSPKGESMKNSLDWKTVVPEDNQTSWQLSLTRKERGSMEISQYMPGGKGLLSLPNGTVRIDNLPAGSISKNGFGEVRASDAPSLLSYRARYALLSTTDRPNTGRDLQIPDRERPPIQEIVDYLQLEEKYKDSLKEALRAVHWFYRTRFRYSTYLDTPHKPDRNYTPLGHFLTKQHAGHCEFFATATVLTLRAAGIPARYAVGYSVQEAVGVGSYVVRERHAHAWCLVWSKSDNAWIDFDTTPSAWGRIESENAPLWEPVSDFGSRLWFEFSQWRAGRSEMSRYLVYSLSSILLAFIARVFINTRRRTAAGERKGLEGPRLLGTDSEFYLLERVLTRQGLGRHPEETPQRWLERIRGQAAQPELLSEIVALHYHHRFDPSGLPPDDRRTLRAKVGAWMAFGPSGSSTNSAPPLQPGGKAPGIKTRIP